MNLFWFVRSSGASTSDGSVLDTELKQPRLVLFFTAIAFFSFLLWAYFSEIDQVARAPGVVIPSSKIQIIQSKDGGVLLALPVGAGDFLVLVIFSYSLLKLR